MTRFSQVAASRLTPTDHRDPSLPPGEAKRQANPYDPYTLHPCEHCGASPLLGCDCDEDDPRASGSVSLTDLHRRILANGWFGVRS